MAHYIVGLAFLFLFRLLLFFTYKAEHTIDIENESTLIKKSFLIGCQFDSVILGYSLALPLIVLVIHSFVGKGFRIYKWISGCLYILTLISFYFSAADIPYFNYNFARISAVIFKSTADAKIIFSMILEEPTYAIYFLVWLGMFLAYLLLVRKLIKFIPKTQLKVKSNVFQFVFILVGLGLVFFALRGRLDSPIRVNHSFFCDNSFYNQLGLNPTFVLIKSLKQSQEISIIDNKDAINNVKEYLNITENLNLNSPLARNITTSDSVNKKNVVLVIMESMSANKLARFGNKDKLTPYFDELAKKSICFDNMYSAGFHTCNGIFSTLYSYPTVLRERPMTALNISYFNSLPRVFKDYDYKNLYFTAGNENFDNVGAFIRQNDISTIISGKDFDPKLLHSSFGVPDHILFDYTLERLNQEREPFFATVMTVSDHGPYIIPKDISFEPKQSEIKKQVVEYADWSIHRFLEKAKTQSWYKNTVFVFVADHGVVMGDITYEIPFSLHHIPLLIFSPDTSFIKARIYNNYATQMDVLPTIAGLLNFNYINNTFGQDLLKEKREYGVFSSDDKFGCINDGFYYIYRKNGKETLHQYKNRDPSNCIKEFPEQAEKMKKHVVSIMQSGKLIISENKTH